MFYNYFKFIIDILMTGKVPMIQIIIAGNNKTVKKVKKYLERNIPVIIVYNTGGAAELIAWVKENR